MIPMGHSGQRVRRISRSVYIKDLLCRFRNRVCALQLLQNTKLFLPTQIFICFQWQSKVVAPVGTPSSYSLYIICCRGGSMSQVVGLPNNSYKPITNTVWIRARLCKLQKGCTRLAAANDKIKSNQFVVVLNKAEILLTWR